MLSKLRRFLNSSPDDVLMRLPTAARVSPAQQSAAISILVRNAVMDVTSEWLGKPKSTNMAARAVTVRNHLEEANFIISSIEKELEAQAGRLTQLTEDIEEKKRDAAHWETLASANEELAQALAVEVEHRVRDQIRIELNKGKEMRFVRGLIFFFINVIIGALAGYFIPKWFFGS
jgi:uncharacterized membrane protein required for colicin V production